MASPTSTITVRPPSAVVASKASPASGSESFHSPAITWLKGTWNVSYSTLPMWKSKRNVQITYTPLPPSNGDGDLTNTDRMDDVVTYQGLNSDAVKTVHGLDKASVTPDLGPSPSQAAWDWRGKGWLMIASSHWEVLGHSAAQGQGEADAEAEEWVVTYFAKTLFTPAGIDIYCRPQPKISSKTYDEIMEAVKRVEDAEFQKLVEGMFEISHDQVKT